MGHMGPVVRHLRRTLSGVPVSVPTSGDRPLTTFKRRNSGRWFVDVPPSTDQIVDQLNAVIDEKFGLAVCPSCLEKVAVLVDGECRDCHDN